MLTANDARVNFLTCFLTDQGQKTLEKIQENIESFSLGGKICYADKIVVVEYPSEYTSCPCKDDMRHISMILKSLGFSLDITIENIDTATNVDNYYHYNMNIFW